MNDQLNKNNSITMSKTIKLVLLPSRLNHSTNLKMFVADWKSQRNHFNERALFGTL